MTPRHVGLYLFFGLPIAGALAGSYLHLVTWLRPWMPPGWERLSWVSAMSMDGLIFAPVIARQIVGANVPGLSLRFAQGIGIASSVYVNARWGWETMPTGTWWQRADILAGAAILPVLVLVAELAMRSSLGGLAGRSAGKLGTTSRSARSGTRPAAQGRSTSAAPDIGTSDGRTQTDTGRTQSTGIPATAMDTAPQTESTVRGQKRRTLAEGADIWRAFADRGITETADIAAAMGVDQKTVRRWRAAAE